MTQRERTLAIVLGTFILLMLVGLGCYVGIYLPISAKRATARGLESEISDKRFKLIQTVKDRPRLESALQRSLPTDPDARSEYDAAINKLLRDAKVPLAAYSVRPKAVDNRNVPEITPKLGNVPARLAYNKIALEVTLKPVSYSTLIDVLHRYYRLNLLQQIIKFNVKRLEGGTSARRTSSTYQDRADLEVSFVTEAIILDGAEYRRSLTPVPTAMGAAGGSAGYGALLFSPVITRGIPQSKDSLVLAAADRDYALMLVKDLFHGPPDAPRKEVPPPPKENTSQFIRLTGVGRNPDGTGRAFIEDIASHQQYEIELKHKDGDLVAEVVKFYFINRIKKSYAPEAILDISESSSGTARKFRVIGLDGDSLILAERGGSNSAPSTGRKPSRGRNASPTPTPPSAAVLGGVATAIAPVERIVAWKHGDSLDEAKSLSREDGQMAVQRATAGQPEAIPTKPATVPVTTPPPRPANGDNVDPNTLTATSSTDADGNR